VSSLLCLSTSSPVRWKQINGLQAHRKEDLAVSNFNLELLKVLSSISLSLKRKIEGNGILERTISSRIEFTAR